MKSSGGSQSNVTGVLVEGNSGHRHTWKENSVKIHSRGERPQALPLGPSEGASPDLGLSASRAVC